MKLHLNGTENIIVKDKSDGTQDITIEGIDFKQQNGTIRKVSMVFPNTKINEETKTLIVFASKADKSLWTIELNEK